MRPLSLRFRARALAALILLVFGFASGAQAASAVDPNIQTKIDKYLYQPLPEDLILWQDKDGKGSGKQAPKAKGGKN